MAIFPRRRRSPEGSPPDPSGTAVGGIQEIHHRPDRKPPPATAVAPPPAAADQPPQPAPASELVGRFPSAAAALAFNGELISLGLGERATILHDSGASTCWVAVVVPTPLGRELITTCGGRGYLRVGDRFVPERGWGAAAPLRPAAKTWVGRPADGEPVSGLREATPRDLIRLAGLHSVREASPTRVTVLSAGFGVGPLVRRTLELGLRVTHRPVELRPLFTDGAGSTDTAGSVLIAVEISRPPARSGDVTASLPESLLRALDLDPQLLLCRMPGDELLVQYGLGAALADGQLLDLVPPGRRWVLADAVFGCAVFRDLAEPRDSTGLVRRHPIYEIASPVLGGRPSTVEPVAVNVVADRVETSHVDAILLEDDDLPLLSLLLQGHPLAEQAWISFGRDRHLLFAAGGLLQRLPIGEPLYRMGPGALYLPVGYRLSPVLPAAARRELFEADGGHAVILLPGRGLAFDVSEPSREPVWTLWAGELPEIDWQLPDEAVERLEAVEAEFRPKPEARRPAPRTPRPYTPPVAAARPAEPVRARTWRDEAWEHETAGDLVAAAKLFERHGEPVTAAHLYEAAARADRPTGARR
ncbi:hypothetical protein AB0C38_13600 [Amycolatopsis sp. NPDC048633]|uniref:hypothetical protein n=1 Tax=Amycolatopsis sp. NPDC048633 TaxID=3157095 RepID=UPI003411D561